MLTYEAESVRADMEALGNRKFITFEGCEGSGKSTILMMVSEYLSTKGIEFITTREPGGVDIAEQIRSVILDDKNTNMDPRTEALLYASARRQHLVEKVIPALDSGKVVICDRFIDSSLVYQGYARGVGISEIMNMNSFALDGYNPSLTIYLDIDPIIGLSRIHNDGKRDVNRIDLESLHFHKRVREGYLLLSENYARIKQVDASRTVYEVFDDVISLINTELMR